MALRQSTLGQRIVAHQELWPAALAVTIIVLMLVMTVVFGIRAAAPSYQIVPDPASAAGLPF